MATVSPIWENASATPVVDTLSGAVSESWYAVQTRARHERVVVQRFREKGLTTFLPLVTEVRRWSDRKKSVEVPLFGCYVFVKMMPTNEDRLKVLRTDSVFDLVGVSRYGTPMPDDQIDTSDIPELPPDAWKNAVRGRFYRPLKQAVSMRLDADVVAWLKKRGKGYQTRANSILRQRMLDETKRA